MGKKAGEEVRSIQHNHFQNTSHSKIIPVSLAGKYVFWDTPATIIITEVKN